MKKKQSRLDTIKMIISGKETGSQKESLQELYKERFIRKFFSTILVST